MAVVSIQDRNRHTANQLLNAAMNYARLILTKYGQIGPFGFSMSREGEIARETLDIPRLPGDPQRLWKLLSDHIAEKVRRGKLKAVLMGANVSLTETSAEGYKDAVLLEIEEESGYAIEATIPYGILGGQLWGLLPRRLVMGEMVAEESSCRFFGGGPGRKS
ncbi:MAG TPA: hypothetical protein VJV22_21425 [Acidobacteriaceae bacterium]|nr:hypothetical protein [Acidobacteriaceae bacterium]